MKLQLHTKLVLIKIVLISIFVTISVQSLYAYVNRDILLKQITREQLKEVLVMNQQWVTFPAYSDRQGWDRILGNLKAFYIRRGESLLNYEWKVIKATDYIEYDRSGARNIMEIPFDSNNRAIAELLMAELAEGKGRFVDQLINGVFHCCEMTSWALSAHVQQRLKQPLPTYSDSVFDLAVGEVGCMLSWTYYFMKNEFDKVNPEISRRLRYELQVRVLDPYMQNAFGWMARDSKSTPQNNWNPWCNCNALIAYMLLENNRETLTNAVYESMRSVDVYLNYVNGDGACDEGPSYWVNAAGRVLDYIEILSTITQGKVNVSNNKLIKEMGEYISHSYVGNGWVVNFADASPKWSGDPYLAFRYGELVNSESLKHYAGSIWENLDAPVPSTSVYRLLKSLEVKDRIVRNSSAKMTPFVWYPETEFCYLSNDDGFFVACKGGYNNESHNHNDVGSFNLYIDQTPVLIDVGVGTYTRQTFSADRRYNIWTMQSSYHNLPMINGVPEKDGYKYKSRNVVAKPNFFTLDISGAYPEAANVEKWIRTYNLRGTELIVSDDYSLCNCISPNIINFMTWGDVLETQDGQIAITVNKVKAKLIYDIFKFRLIIEPIVLTDPQLKRAWGDKVYRLSFVAKTLPVKGNYKFKIMKL